MTATPASDAGQNTEAHARRWLREQLAPAQRDIGLTALYGVMAGWLVIPQAGLIAWVISALLVDRRGAADLQMPLFMLLAIILLRAILTWLRHRQAAHTAIMVRERSRRESAARVYALGPIGIARAHSGRLASAVLDQVDSLGDYAARYRPQLWQAALIPAGILVTVATLDWLAALLLFLSAPLIPLFMALVGMGAAAVNRGQFQALARLSGQFLDRLQGLDVLRHYALGDAAAEDIEQASRRYRQRTMAVLRVAFLSSAVLEFFSAVAIAMIAIYIGLGLLGFQQLGPAPDLTLYSGLFILLLAPEFFAPLRDLGQHYHDRAAALGAVAELAPLLSTPSPMAPVAGIRPAPSGTPRLTLATVNARYPGGHAVFRTSVTLSVEPGETVLVTGPSGSGKSTLLYLIAGLLQRSDGAIRLDDCLLEDYSREALGRCLGWLGQRAHLLPGSLRANLMLSRVSADPQRILRAAGEAGVMRFAATSLPDGLDTVVGERGHGLSGGEAQRVALARLLVHDPRLLLLDEPTASLDPESRDIVLQVLRRLASQGRTLVVATHQPELFPWAGKHLDLGVQDG